MKYLSTIIPFSIGLIIIGLIYVMNSSSDSINNKQTYNKVDKVDVDENINNMEFYKKPNFNKLINRIETYEKQYVKNSKEYLKIMSFIEVTVAIEKHPEYVNSIINDFSKYSKFIKNTFVNGLMGASNNNAVKKIVKLYKYKVNKEYIYSSEKLLNLKITQAGQLDYLWCGFFISGERKYIEKIIRFINHDDVLLTCAFEYRSRVRISKTLSELKNKYVKPDIDDLAIVIQKRFPKKNIDSLMHIVKAIDIADWSLTSIRNQDPKVNMIYEEIVKKQSAIKLFDEDEMMQKYNHFI